MSLLHRLLSLERRTVRRPVFEPVNVLGPVPPALAAAEAAYLDALRDREDHDAAYERARQAYAATA
jgi:hypothetical protein